MQITTKGSKAVWKTPDGSRTLYEVTLEDAEGKTYGLKTYSEKIAQVGFSGDVETYINTKGDRIVRQVPKPQASTGGGRGNYQPRDDAAIRAQWSLGQASQTVKWDEPNIDHFALVEDRAKKFYALVDHVKGSEPTNHTANVSTAMGVDQSDLESLANTEPPF